MNVTNINTTQKDARTEQKRDTFEISISELAILLFTRAWLIILIGLIAAVGAYFYTERYITPTYSSTARVYILNRQNTNSTSASDLSSASELKDDFRILVRSGQVCRDVLERIGDQVGKTTAQYKSLAGHISVDANASRFCDITVTDADPVVAKLLVDELADVARIKAKLIMGVEDITIEEYGAVAVTPSAPNMRRNVITSACFGIIIACIIITLFYLLNSNIRNVKDVEHSLGLCVLGSVPDVSSLRHHRKHKHSKHKKKS